MGQDYGKAENASAASSGSKGIRFGILFYTSTALDCEKAALVIFNGRNARLSGTTGVNGNCISLDAQLGMKTGTGKV
ncbi:hypothetical protein V6N13_009561 [Hibiscus sabdariffa]